MKGTRETIVGLVFFLGLGLLGYFTFNAGILQLAPRAQIFLFQNVVGLEEGSQVMVDGLVVGKVMEMNLVPGGVEVLTHLKRDLVIRQSDQICIEERGMLGWAVIAIHRGDPDARPCAGTIQGGVGASLGSLLARLQQIVIENQEKFSLIVDNLNLIVQDIQQAQGLLGTLISDPELANKVRAVVEDLAGAADSIASITGQVREGPGAAHLLIYDEELPGAVREAVADIRAATGKIRELTANIGEEGTVLNRLLNDEELGENLRRTLANLRRMTDCLDRSDGSLGLLINDPQLYRQLVGAVTDLRETFEDVREQVPISSFTGILFSFF